MLLAEGLRHAFGSVLALDDVSFTLRSGQTLAVFGPNGAGKTTLLKVLAGLIRPGRGRARVEGGRRAVGWIGHQPQLYAQLTVWENLRFWASLYDVPEDAYRRREQDLLSRLGLQPYQHRLVRELSRGLVQRVAIARALIHGPSVLLLDEPFTGLDLAAAAEVRALLGELREAGRIVVLATHNVDEGVELATDIAFQHRGRFVHFAPRGSRTAAQISDEYRRAVARE
ncbi:MAG: heme ABC exporter ATP-binding protein CcmA [bacterium]